MQFIALIYNDPDLLNALPAGEADRMMRGCLAHADELKREGRLLHSRMLAGPEQARSIRVRDGRLSAVDGPFAEAKEVLGGFNLIEANDIDEAVRIASSFPWAQTGCVEVRPVQPISLVRAAVGGPATESELDAG